jgi:hypothetical protein
MWGPRVGSIANLGGRSAPLKGEVNDMDSIMQMLAAAVIVVLAAWIINRYMPASGNSRAIVNLVLMLIVVGMALWAINTYLPIAPPIMAILNIVVVVAVCVRVLQVFGLWEGTVRLGRKMASYRPKPDNTQVPREPTVVRREMVSQPVQEVRKDQPQEAHGDEHQEVYNGPAR